MSISKVLDIEFLSWPMSESEKTAIQTQSEIQSELDALLEARPELEDCVAPVRGEPKDPEIHWAGGAAYSSNAYPLIRIPVAQVPGSLWAGPLPDRRRLGFLTSQLEALVTAGVQRVVCLIPEMDLLGRYGVPEYPAEAKRLFGDGACFLEVANYAVPQVDGHFERAIRDVSESLARGEGVLVHCGAGCGRAGMFVACVLVHSGMDPHQAIRTFRQYRTCGPETASQVAYVFRFAERRDLKRVG